jgi:phosphate transport system substrate-binding protein
MMPSEIKMVEAPDVECSGCHRSLFHILLSLMVCLWCVPFQAQENVVIVGSGSSVPAPLYNRWAREFEKNNPRIQLRYLTVGTSEGIKDVSHGSGDFAAGEALLPDREQNARGLVALPVVLIAITPIYNLPSIHQQLRLSGEVLAEIFLGDLKNWNSVTIARLNPDINLPNLPIRVVTRPNGKGSNYIFTDFLSRESSRFRTQIGVTTSPKWPVGISANRSSDMVDQVEQQPGSIGFVEMQYAVKANVPTVAVLNAAGKFVSASNEGILAACQNVESPNWEEFSASLTGAMGVNSFPLASFSWVYLRSSSFDVARADALRDLLNWIYSDGQRFAGEEGYSELPQRLLIRLREKVKDPRLCQSCRSSGK